MGKTHWLYRSDTVEAIYREGSSRWTLVLFESAAFVGEDGGQAQRAFLRQADINAVVISAKQRNWYPAAHMAACFPAVQQAVKDVPVVTLGSSMGGYAAIKYARRLGARRAVALSPQYSIDPARLLPADPFAGSFIPELHAGMEITAEDAACPVDIMLDPVDPFDNEHGRLISLAIPCRTTHVRFGGHALEVLFAGPTALAELVAAFVDDDHPAARRLVRACKRRSVYFHERLYQHLRDRRPAAARWALDTALSLHPVGTDNHVSRFQAQMKLGRPELAAVELRQAFDRANRNASRVYLARALSAAAAALGQRDESVSWMRRALDCAPEDDAILISYVLRLIHAGRHAEAAPILADLRRRPGDPTAFYAMSLALKAEGRLAEATEAARQSLVAGPGNAGIRGYLAQLLSQAGKKAEAEALLATAVASMGDSGSWFEWSKFLHGEARFYEALDAARHAVRLTPSDPGMRNHLATLLMQDDQPEAALEICQDSVNIWIGGGTCLTQMSAVLAQLGRTQEAVAALTRATVQEPALAEHWAALIDLFLRLNDLSSAAQTAKQAYDGPCTRTATLLLAHSRLCLRMSDLDGAIENARQATAAMPENPGCRGALANYLLQADQPAAAAAEAQQAVLLAPEAFWLRQILITALERCGQAEAALHSLRDAIAANPSNGELRGLLAFQLLQRGDAPEAGAAVKAALDAGLETGSLWEVQAQLRLQLGDLPGTVAAMRRATALAPANPQYFGALANYLLAMDRAEEAVEPARQALRLEPGVPWLRHALLTAMTRAGRTDEAIAICHDAVAAAPADAEPRAALASLLYKSGRKAEAAEAIARAAAAGLQAASLYEVEAGLLLDAGDMHGAAKAMRHAVALAPDDAGLNGALANYLLRNGDPVAAEAAASTAIRLRPGVAWLYTALSLALQQQGKLDMAIDAAREATRCAPADKMPAAHLDNLLALQTGRRAAQVGASAA